jgi:hypothetical protein
MALTYDSENEAQTVAVTYELQEVIIVEEVWLYDE